MVKLSAVCCNLSYWSENSQGRFKSEWTAYVSSLEYLHKWPTPLLNRVWLGTKDDPQNLFYHRSVSASNLVYETFPWSLVTPAAKARVDMWFSLITELLYESSFGRFRWRSACENRNFFRTQTCIRIMRTESNFYNVTLMRTTDFLLRSACFIEDWQLREEPTRVCIGTSPWLCSRLCHLVHKLILRNQLELAITRTDPGAQGCASASVARSQQKKSIMWRSSARNIVPI